MRVRIVKDVENFNKIAYANTITFMYCLIFGPIVRDKLMEQYRGIAKPTPPKKYEEAKA